MAGGYFVEPAPDEVTRWLFPESNGITLRSIRNVPCLVLLGDMGMGKSTTVKEEYAALLRDLDSRQHKVVIKDLKRRTEEQIYRQVFGDPAVEGWRRGEHQLTLFLDSLDECWRRIDEMESILVGELERCIQSTNAPLFLRATCRSAEWRAHVGEAFARLFREREHENGPVQAYTLAPLSEKNVRQAAESQGRDGNDLVSRIAERQVQVLASHPITFGMLFRIYVEGGCFPNSRVDLYDRGCTELCGDLHSVFGSSVQKDTSREQRFAIARRFAAISVLTNRYLINGNPESLLGRPDVLEASELFGHFDEAIGGQRVGVNRETSVETLQAALFSEVVDGAQNWRHQSYAEFLAAKYLATSKLSLEQLSSLLTDTTNNARRLVPQLEETACWLVEMRPELFAALAPWNADVFIRCDPKQFDDPKRELLVDGYLGLIRNHEAPEIDWQLKHQLGRLQHKTLERQLARIIVNRTENALVRESAVDIAAYCRCNGVAQELIEIFSDETDVFRVRQRAAFALEQMKNEEIRLLVKKCVVVKDLDDEMDELKGFYFKVLWPSCLSTTEMLPLLTQPKRQNYTGSYKLFLAEAAKKMPDSDLPLVLDWMMDKEVSFDRLGSFGQFPSEIAARAVQRLDEPRIRRAVIAILRDPEGSVRHFLDPYRGTLGPTPQVREVFWDAVISEGLEPRPLITFGYIQQAGFLSADDMPFFVEKYRGAEAKHRMFWEQLIFSVFDPKHLASLEHVSSLANCHSHVAETLAAFTSCPLVPDEINWQKKGFQRQKTDAAEAARASKRPSIIEKIEEGLDRFDQGDALAFCWVLELLDTDPERPEQFGSLNARLSTGKVWPLLSPELKARVLASGRKFLTNHSCPELDAWDGEKNYRMFLAVDPVTLLLFDESRSALSDLTGEQMSPWIPALFAYHDRHNGSHDEGHDFLFGLAFRLAREEFLASLSRFLDLHVDHDSKRRLIWWLSSAWHAELNAIFRQVVRDRALKATTAMDILHLLCTQDQAGSIEMLREIWDKRRRKNSCSILVPVAGVVLLRGFPEMWGSRILDSFKENPPLCRRIAWLLLHGIGQSSDWISRIPAQLNAELWDWLDGEFPGDPYLHEGDGAITAAHEMADFNRAVFQGLIQRTSREACEALKWLMRRRPQAFWLGDVLARMKKAARGAVWNRPSSAGLMKTFSDSERRLIRTAGDLQSLLMESLARLQKSLRGSPPSMELWNEVAKGRKKRKKIIDPKDEMNLSNRIKFHFESDLDRFGIVAGREVQIRPRLGKDAAQLVDVLVHAAPVGDDGNPGKAVSVVVEVKCSWNPGVLDDMEKQLRARYLATEQFDFGIYLVGHFTCQAWNRVKDTRKKSGVSGRPLGSIKNSLLRQARKLSSTEKRIEAFLLDARIAQLGIAANKRVKRPRKKKARE